MNEQNRVQRSPLRAWPMKYAICLPLLILLAMAAVAKAQSTSGSIIGTVHDASGSVIPGAKLTLTNTGTSETRALESDSNGSYQFVNLAPGRYEITIEKQGFKRKVFTNLQVEVQQVVREDAALDVGNVTETVQVTEQAALLETEQSTLSQSVQGRTVQEMPLNGRNVMNLVSLAPGVVPQGNTSGNPMGGANGSSFNANGWGNYQIGGGAANQSASYFDGAPLNVSYVNSTILVPTQDAVQEFRVATNNVSPEFGRFSGGVINLASKSGANTLHGSAYEYVRNTLLNASNYFATSKPGFHQNQYGASLSGPIKKDKTFFLGTWEKFSVSVGVPTATNVPTSAMSNGDFSALLGASIGQTNPCDGTPLLTGAIYDPTTTKLVNGVPCRTAFSGNKIPSTRLDPTAVIMAGQFGAPQGPLASALPGTGSGNWQGNGTGGGNTNQYNARIDHALSDSQRLFGRYTFWNGKTIPNDLFHNKATANQNIYTTQNAVLGYTWTLNPTTVADVRLSYLRFIFGFYPPSTGTSLASFGAAYAALAPHVLWQQPPASQVQGFQTFNYVTARNQNNNEALSESLTKIMGKHSLKFGAESRLIEWGYGQTNYSSGQFTFNNAFTALNPQSTSKFVPTGTSYSSGYSYASFILGYAANPSQIQEILIAKQQMWYHGLYAADTFQMNSKLTLNLGIRWEYPGQFKEAHNSAAVFLPTATDTFGTTVGLNLKGLTTMVNTSAYPDRAIHPEKLNAFAPRIGFAYRFSNDGVLRGGYGISYLPNDVIFGNAPWTTPPSLATTPMNFSNDGGLTPANVLSNPFPGGILQPSRNVTNLENSVLGAIIQLPVPNQKYPYAQQWNLAIQQQFAGNVALEIGYAGSKGTGLPVNVFIRGFPYFELNQLADTYDICGTDKTQSQCGGHLLTDQVTNPFYGKVPSTATILAGPTIAYGQLLRPYPQYQSVNNTSAMYGSTTWHGLLTKVEKRFNGGGMILGTYTWSKLIGNSDTQTAWLDGSGGGNAAGIQDYTNLKGNAAIGLPSERSIASFDVPQRATISYVLDLPVGRGQRYGANMSKLMDEVLGGWGINGTTTFQSGFPIIMIAQPSTLNGSFGAGITRANFTAGCKQMTTGSAFSRVSQWFNTSCYTQPGGYAFGNAPRTSSGLRAQGIANWDAALNKNFSLTERTKLKFDAEFFNLFNRVQFAAPTAQVGNINNGKITATRNQQRLIQLALRLSF